MPRDDRDVLEVLKAELDFIEKGGYGRSVRTPWKPTSIFVDSPSCINFGDHEMRQPCEDCLLLEFVPPERRLDCVPCHRIPLNQRGETVESLVTRGNQQDLEEAVKTWLREAIRRIEEARSEAQPAEPVEKGGWWKRPEPGSHRQRVLVVDDDENILILLEALLENEGYSTTTAWGGREALLRLGSGVFDFIVLDDYLPDVPSEEILRQVQKKWPDTPVLLTQTAVLTDEAAARYARLGAHYFVSKSQPVYVAALVRDYLNHAKALPAHA